MVTAAKSPGQVAYEEEVRRRPWYHDGRPRVPWAELSADARWSWERNPTVADVVPTRVLFRVYPQGDVLALLLDCEANRGYVVCYAHVGQHGEADYTHVITSTKPATPDQYKDLYAELQRIGYQLEIRKRR